MFGATGRDPWGNEAERAELVRDLARQIAEEPVPRKEPPPPRQPASARSSLHKWNANARVSADYCSLGYYHDATITALNPDGSYSVVYDDGLVEDRVPQNRIAPPGGPRGENAGGNADGRWDPPPPKPVENRRRRAASPAARRPVDPPGPGLRRPDGLGEGSQAQGNWQNLGYWHPCTVLAVLPNGGCKLQYDDGYTEDAPPECVLPVGVSTSNGGGMVFEAEPLGGGGFGAAAVQRGSARGDNDAADDRFGRLPLAPRRRRASGVHEAEKARKQFEQERKARLECIKLKPEDKLWAQQHGLMGDRGLFQGMIVRYRNANPSKESVSPNSLGKNIQEAPISVFVRKRPMLPDELRSGGFDVVTPHSSEVSSGLVVHEPKVMVDLSKAMDNHTYRFDGVFGELSTNAQIFEGAVKPMVETLFNTRGGHGTCFAYGQTGSGKTVTMEGLGHNSPNEGNMYGLYWYVAHEIFRRVAMEGRDKGRELVVKAGFFEIYRGKCFDLLARKRKIEVMEDEKGMQCLVGLSWADLTSAEALLHLLSQTSRTTRATAQNDSSSRSHAILQIMVCEPAAQSWQSSFEVCKLSLVDLAGSEWAAKAQSDDRGNRLDGAEINKSLLCLKECIRALGAHGSHVPFRGSKLTQVLKDSFVGKDSRTVMIANISPSSVCCEHSINTIRYAQRVKEWTAASGAAAAAAAPSSEPPAQPTAAGGSSRPGSRHGSRPGSRAASPPDLTDPAAGDRINPVPRLPLPNDASPEVRNADSEHQKEAIDLSRSLKWSAEQLKAAKAQKMVLAAEEGLIAAHGGVVSKVAVMLPQEQSLLEKVNHAGGDVQVDEYVSQLREMIAQRRDQLAALEGALATYEASCASEDTARKNVKAPVSLPWG